MQGLLRSEIDPVATGHNSLIAAWNHSFTRSGLSPLCIGAYSHTFKRGATAFLEKPTLGAKAYSRATIIGEGALETCSRKVYLMGGLVLSQCTPPRGGEPERIVFGS